MSLSIKSIQPGEYLHSTPADKVSSSLIIAPDLEPYAPDKWLFREIWRIIEITQDIIYGLFTVGASKYSYEQPPHRLVLCFR